MSLPWTPLFLAILWIIHPWFLYLAFGLVLLSALIQFARNSLTAEAAARHQAVQKLEAETLQDAQVIIAGSGMPGVFLNVLGRMSVFMKDRLALADNMMRPTVLAGSLSGFLRGATQLLALSLGAALVVTGDLSAGGMIAASLILARSVTAFEQVLTFWPEMQAARAAFRRLLDSDQSDVSPSTGIPELSGGLSCQSLIFPRGGGAPALGLARQAAAQLRAPSRRDLRGARGRRG